MSKLRMKVSLRRAQGGALVTTTAMPPVDYTASRVPMLGRLPSSRELEMMRELLAVGRPVSILFAELQDAFEFYCAVDRAIGDPDAAMRRYLEVAPADVPC